MRNVSAVLGRVAVGRLGRTLTHEHISASIAQKPTVFYREAPKEIANLPNFDDSVINLDNCGLVRQYPSVYAVNFVIYKIHHCEDRILKSFCPFNKMYIL